MKKPVENKSVEKIELHYPGRCRIEYTPDSDVSSGNQGHELKVSGSLALLKMIQDLQQKSSQPATWSLPEGATAEALILKEFILKARGEWNPPYQEDLICFCRSIQTQTIQEAIISGVHCIEDLRELTTANTGCGTCQDRTEDLVAYYLKA